LLTYSELKLAPLQSGYDVTKYGYDVAKSISNMYSGSGRETY